MIVGIDLGTTNSLIAYFDGDHAKVIPNRLGENLTPSVVSVDEEGIVYVGKTAKERKMLYPDQTADVFQAEHGQLEGVYPWNPQVLCGRAFQPCFKIFEGRCGALSWMHD